LFEGAVSSVCFFLIFKDYSRGGCLIQLIASISLGHPTKYEGKMTKESLREKEKTHNLNQNMEANQTQYKKKSILDLFLPVGTKILKNPNPNKLNQIKQSFLPWS